LFSNISFKDLIIVVFKIVFFLENVKIVGKTTTHASIPQSRKGEV